ncbi:class I glutamine amidotransferase-like protein [Atractiella rhizophila]|nr:class I glutamine amidotransferase-like protein [Atractiella rhizophila]
MTKKILIVLTSHPRSEDSLGGWFLNELAHPYNIFKNEGYEIVLASTNGGEAPLDPWSIQVATKLNDSESLEFFEAESSLWKNTIPLSEFLGKASEYDAIFYPGGDGPTFDLATSETNQKLIAEF